MKGKIVKRLGLGLGTGTWDLGPGTSHQVDSDNNNLGESNMIEGKVIKNP